MIITYGRDTLVKIVLDRVTVMMDNNNDLAFFEIIAEMLEEEVIAIKNLGHLETYLGYHAFDEALQKSSNLNPTDSVFIYDRKKGTINSYNAITDYKKCPTAEEVTEYIVDNEYYTLEYNEGN